MSKPTPPGPRPQTWLLLRGLTREAGHWGAFPGMLQRALPAGGEAVCLDLPGNGTLHQLRSPTRVEEFVAHLRQETARRGIDRPAIVAMSLGAMVTAAWAQRHPQELACGVLINTSLRPFSPFWDRLRPGQWATFLALLATRGGHEAWERAILDGTTRHPQARRDVLLASWLALRARHPVSAANALRQLLAASQYRGGIHPPAVPLLVLRGAGDRFVHPRCSEALASAWRLPMATHPTAGHDLPLDAPEWVVQQIAQWVVLRGGLPAPPPGQSAPAGLC